MKNRFNMFMCAALSVVLIAGCVASKPTTAPVLPVVQVQAKGGDKLTGADLNAVAVLDIARTGVSPESGTVRLAPNAQVALIGPETGFSQTDTRISNVRTMQDGNNMVEVLRRFEDANGRTQMMLDMAVYSMQQPTKGELNANSVAFITDYKTVMKSGTEEAKQEAREAVTAFQQQAGLTADGALGPQTSMAMAKALGIQEFSLLASAPIYPDNPRYSMYIMDEVLAKNDPDTYLKGFASMSAVAAKAIPEAQLPSRSKSGGSFLAALYFMDQLPKDSAIQVGFSEFENRKDSDFRSTMRPVYSTGKSWPVVYVPFKIERSTNTKKLYALVLINGTIVKSMRLR